MSCTSCTTCTIEDRKCAFNTFKDKYAQTNEFQYNFVNDAHPEVIMLGLTNRCNLSCTYCFVNQNPLDMTFQIAEDSIKWLQSNYKIKNLDRKMSVNFFGGEPLLLYDEIIRPLVLKYQDEIAFGITTNGILLDEDKVDFFFQHNIQPLLSFDGVPEVQNCQRISHTCNSFKTVLNNIPYLLLRFPQTVMRSTVTKESIPHMYDSVLMAQELGFKKIVFCPNAYEDWDKETELELYEQLNKIGLHIYKGLRNQEFDTIMVDPLNVRFSDINKALTEDLYFNNSVNRCGLGTTTCAITPIGDIVPCQEKISNPTIVLGNIYEGINQQIHQDYLTDYYAKVNNLECDKGCDNRSKLICLSDICPSRLEDLDYTFSTSQCAFIRMSTKVAGHLHLLCSGSIFPHIREFFGEEDLLNETN